MDPWALPIPPPNPPLHDSVELLPDSLWFSYFDAVTSNNSSLGFRQPEARHSQWSAISSNWLRISSPRSNSLPFEGWFQVDSPENAPHRDPPETMRRRRHWKQGRHLTGSRYFFSFPSPSPSHYFVLLSRYTSPAANGYKREFIRQHRLTHRWTEIYASARGGDATTYL